MTLRSISASNALAMGKTRRRGKGWFDNAAKGWPSHLWSPTPLEPRAFRSDTNDSLAATASATTTAGAAAWWESLCAVRL